MADLKLTSGPFGSLLETAQLADGVLSQLHDALVLTDSEGRITYTNEGFHRLLGYAPAEARGQPMAWRLGSVARRRIEAELTDVMLGQPYSQDWEDTRADGSRVWIHWRIKRVVDADGRIAGAIAVGTDVSERKQAESEREQLQQQLYQAQRLDTLGTLAGGIAHDFNNILAIIVGFTEIALSRGTLDEQTKHMHEQVLRAGHRGRDLVSRILSFSRFHHPERRPVALGDVLQDASKFIRATMPSTINVVVDIAPECSATLADAHQLHQVLLNLATNAAHAMRDQHGVFGLKLYPRELKTALQTATSLLPAGSYLVLEAMDSGCGMDETTRSRVFDPFFTTKKEGEGTGLGLSVVRAIIDGHSGGIEVGSVIGRGSTFSLYIPVVAGVALPAIDPEEQFTPRLRARGETVAVIDDDETLVSVTERVLQSLGYSTLTFRSAESFHATYTTAPSGINLLVTDQTMPGMTGLELGRRLRDAGHALPILLMTGFSKQLRAELVQQLGHAALLRKPFDRAALARSVRELLDADL